MTGAVGGDPGFDLAGRRALVTGASAGIGAAIAIRLARAGATVVAVSRSGRAPDGATVGGAAPEGAMPDGAPADGAAGGDVVPEGAMPDGAAASPPGRVIPLVADLSSAADIDRVVDRTVELLGGLDIVVNNAGRGDWRALAEIDRAYFDELIALNLWAPLRICQLAHPHLRTATDPAVVMIGSVDAVRPSAGGAVYGASKAGLAAVTVALAKEWRADGIRVTQVDPGIVDTPLAAEVVADLERTGFDVNLAGRAGTGDEIAALVHYLVAPVGRFATGVSFRLDGGALALGPFDARRT